MASCRCELEAGSRYSVPKTFLTPAKSSHEGPSGWIKLMLKMVAAGTWEPESVPRLLRYCPSRETKEFGNGPGMLNRAFAMCRGEFGSSALVSRSVAF